MKILVVCGSPREQANTRVLAKAVEGIVRARGVDLLTFDVRYDRLPLFGMEEEDGAGPGLVKLRSDARAADGMVICTPEYHNGISGALKNALDFLGGDVFAGKGILLLAAAGGGKGGINALNQLRLIMRALSGHALPGQSKVRICAEKECETLLNDGMIIGHENANLHAQPPFRDTESPPLRASRSRRSAPRPILPGLPPALAWSSFPCRIPSPAR